MSWPSTSSGMTAQVPTNNPASGSNAWPTAAAAMPTTMPGPAGVAAAMRVVTNAAASAAAPPQPTMMPSAAGETCRSRIQIQHVECADRAAADRADDLGDRQRPEQAMAEHDQEPDLEVVPRHARTATFHRRRLLVRQAPKQEGGDDIADRIAQDRDRRAQDLHQHAADRRADDLRRGRGRFLLGVGVQQPAFLDQGRHIGLVRRIEDEGAGHDQEDHDQQMRPARMRRPRPRAEWS